MSKIAKRTLYALAALFAIFAVTAWMTAAARASCRTCYRAQVVAPAYNVVPFQAATYNFVGAPVRLQAEQAYTMANHPDYPAFQRFLAFNEGVKYAQQQAQQAAQQPHQQPPADPGPPEPVTGEEQQGGPPEPPAAPLPPQDGEAPFAHLTPTIVANCAKCHSGDTPKADLWLDGSSDLRALAAGDKRDAILREVINQRMPPPGKGTLSAEDAGQIIGELYAD